MTESRIIDRIKKMLALANDLSASEGERDNALRMAYATMAKYNIDQASVDNHGKAEDRINFSGQSFSWLWARQINQCIAGLFFCKYYTGMKVNGTQSIHHFVGKESNAMTAAVLADWIVKSILKEARMLYKQNTSPESRSFAMGALHKLVERVSEMKATQQAQAPAGTGMVLASLYVTELAANEDFLKSGGVQLRTSNRKTQNPSSFNAYCSGKEFGGKINLNVQVGGSTQKNLGG